MSHRATSWAVQQRGADGVIKKRARYLWDKTNGHCAYCGREFASPVEMTVDHVVPRARGGSNCRVNKVPCCRSCNATKGSRSLAYLREALQRQASGRPAFNDEQRAYLEAHGFNWPFEARFKFYWERIGNTFSEVERV